MGQLISAPAEIFLSYLTGLAPVGKPFDTRLDTMLPDLGYRSKFVLYRHLNELTKAGCVKRITAGRHNSFGEFVVTKRLEALPREPEPTPEPIDETFGCSRPIHPRQADWYARLAEIPRFDTRSLTALVCGDPLPERSALARRSAMEGA